MESQERPAGIVNQQTVALSGCYDVIVIGGGVAGCAAALAAHRTTSGSWWWKSSPSLEGLEPPDTLIIYLPLDDGYGNQVIGGIAEELLHLSAKYAYYGADPGSWKQEGRRYECKFNGPAFSLALEELLLSEGIDIIYDSLFVGSNVPTEYVTAIHVENKSGRSRMCARRSWMPPGMPSVRPGRPHLHGRQEQLGHLELLHQRGGFPLPETGWSRWTGPQVGQFRQDRHCSQAACRGNLLYGDSAEGSTASSSMAINAC
jgi:hypothetical protein